MTEVAPKPIAATFPEPHASEQKKRPEGCLGPIFEKRHY
jgi:hypothetical protein